MAKRTNMWESNPVITEIKNAPLLKLPQNNWRSQYYQPMRTTIYGDGITSRLVWRVSAFLFNAKEPLVLVPSSPQGVRTLSWTASILWKHPPGDKTGRAVTLISRHFTNFQRKYVLPFNLRSYSYVKFANNWYLFYTFGKFFLWQHRNPYHSQHWTRYPWYLRQTSFLS